MRAYALCESYIVSSLITILSLAPLGVDFVSRHVYVSLVRRLTQRDTMSIQAQFAIGIKGALFPNWTVCNPTFTVTLTTGILYVLIQIDHHVVISLTRHHEDVRYSL